MTELKYLLLNMEEESKYRKKVCNDRVPAITYNLSNQTYTIDLSVMKTGFSQSGLYELERILSPLSDQATFSQNLVTIHTTPKKLSEIHTTTLKLLKSLKVLSDSKKEEEMKRDLATDELWDYWQMLQNYAKFRGNFQYYRAAFEIATNLYERNKGTILDVGTKDITVTLDLFPESFEKIAMDNNFPEGFKPSSNIKLLNGNIYEIDFDEPFDVVLCQQVLEHLPDPKKAFERLIDFCRDTLVISVPYGSWHKTKWDPINEERVLEWTSGRTPNIERIVQDFGVERYVAGYKLGK
jgi:SAM-dependent methyltransferase